MSRLLGRSVKDLAEEVDVALGRLAQARGHREACQLALNLADDDVREAMVAVETARDALFQEHPDLAGGSVSSSPVTEPLVSDDGYEIVEVDDDNDPRFTGGASSIDPTDGAPLPPVVWTEHEG